MKVTQNQQQSSQHHEASSAKRVRMTGPTGHPQQQAQLNQTQEFHHQHSQQQIMFSNAQQQQSNFPQRF